MLLIVKLAPPVFVNVTGCGVLVVPTSCEPKLRLAALSETAGGV